jgi:transcriptional regulator with XRE-family HTH domain
MKPTEQIRHRLGLSQVEFAKLLGVSQGSVSAYEHGRQEISPAVARRMVEVARATPDRGFELTLDQVYGLRPVEQKPVELARFGS